MGYKKILMPTDGSQEAEVAVDHAVNIASQYDAELHILYVVDIGVNSSYDAVTELMSQLESSAKMEEIGRKATESIRKTAEDSGIETSVSIRKGVPHKQINSYTEDEDIDMVVMSTHGRSGIDRMLLGSVFEKVLRSVDVPVLTVRRNNKE